MSFKIVSGRLGRCVGITIFATMCTGVISTNVFRQNASAHFSAGWHPSLLNRETVAMPHRRYTLLKTCTHSCFLTLSMVEYGKHRYPELWNRMRMVITSESLINPSRWYLRFLGLSPPVIAFCSTVLSKTLLKSSQIEKISIILPSGNIAVVFIVCFSTTKLLKIPLFS